MPKLLLTGVVGPHRNLHFDLAGDRLTRDQDIFTVRSHFHYVALHFLAQNLVTHPNAVEVTETPGEDSSWVLALRVDNPPPGWSAGKRSGRESSH